MSSLSGPTSSSTFLRFVEGPLGVKLPDERRLPPSFRTAGSQGCWEQNTLLKGSRSAIENLSDTKGQVSHSIVPVTREPAAGTTGGAGR